MYLGLSIRHCSKYDANGKHYNAGNLYSRVPSSPNVSNEHGHDASATAEDDMHWHGNIVSESVVVQDVDSEEERDVR